MMIDDFFDTAILLLMVALVVLPLGLAVAKTLRQDAGRRRNRRPG